MEKHARFEREGRPFHRVTMVTCIDCGTEHPLNDWHDCPLAEYDCRNQFSVVKFPWTRDACTECPMPKKKWFYLEHDTYVECLYCHETFKVEKWNQGHRDEHQYIWHWEDCPFRDQITADHGALVEYD